MELRIPDQSDFDLETFIEMMDEALTSRDERVQNALRSLLMIVTLTRNTEVDHELSPFETREGPLRRMQEDLRNLSRRLHQLENEFSDSRRQNSQKSHWDYSVVPGGSSTWTGSPGASVTVPVGGWTATDSNGLTFSDSDITITLTDTK